MTATKVNAGLAESSGRLLLGIWRDSLQVTCGLTACTPGSAPGPTLVTSMGKLLPLSVMLHFVRNKLNIGITLDIERLAPTLELVYTGLQDYVGAFLRVNYRLCLRV